ncbi:MAG: hypothetical protein AMS18_07200 [Gemmatimonas sp. SG8_17]|nr:MAG: hypothetical protein AMS18_07200 [Gemmatimonas sp. SG8_17]
MLKHARNERGLALLVAVIGLLVTGMVLSAFVVSGMMERREANSTLRSTQAFAIAEHGLNETIGNWTTASWNEMAVDSSAPVSGTTAGGSGTYAGTVRRLNQELFLIDITGVDAGTRARQNLGALVKLRLLTMDIQAALTTRGPTKVGGSAEIDGTNQDPSGWTGCAADSDLAGLRLPSAGDLTTIGGCSGASCITGSPAVDPDPAINDSTFFEYGDTDWDGLVAMANKVISPGTYTGIGPVIVSGTCMISNSNNWGDPLTPTSACGGYFPIIYAGGNIAINTGYGQGILLVEGDLSVQGGFEFYGIVIVKGQLKTAGTGGHFNGGVLAANVDLDDISVLGDALVQYSSCAITRVLQSAGTGAMLRSRGWLYSY